jgi:hypothetical protein
MRMSTARNLAEAQPLTLKQVCEVIFSDAIAVASLMVEHRRGNLKISKIGRTYVTALADLEEMFWKCRVEASTRYFGPININERMRLFDEAAATLASIKGKQLERKGTDGMPQQMPLSDRMRRHRMLSDGLKTVSPSELPDDLPLSLKEACERLFGGSISVASLGNYQRSGGRTSRHRLTSKPCLRNAGSRHRSGLRSLREAALVRLNNPMRRGLVLHLLRCN